ncbi:RNA polymerase sigma factor [Ruminococcus sp.]|uniref:RNA polymerase sigma factor n=1 Tax=Ruminococcus sp. TaxID=41978 RepID=UPI0025CC6121|nr:RNA polymerase sigma factor [Ruminococcus sp.]
MPQDEMAFAQFYARHVDTVYRVCYIRMKNQMDAEDLTQETFLRAMGQPQLWADEKHARAWLIVTASNLCKNALRHWSHSKREEVEDWESAMGTSEPPDQDSAVLSAVMDLPDQYKTVVYLFYYEGYSGAEIAGMLGKKETTVRSLLHRSRKLLSKSLGGELDAES